VGRRVPPIDYLQMGRPTVPAYNFQLAPYHGPFGVDPERADPGG